MNNNRSSNQLLRHEAQPIDTCETYNNGRKRSCMDCLNVMFQNGQECYLGIDGTCSSVPQSANSSGEAAGYFRSSVTAYCSRDDPACADCRGREDVCIGANGCVCLDSCETSHSNMPAPTSIPSSSESISASGSAFITLYILGVCVFVYMVLIKLGSRHQPSSNSSSLTQPLTTPAAANKKKQHLALTLEGWKQEQKEQIPASSAQTLPHEGITATEATKHSSAA